jgi:hypothetical protein
MDDCSIKGLAICYETEDSGFESIPANPGIHRFVWEHLQDVHHILYRLQCASTTVSAKKLFVAVPEVVVLEHKCTYEGHIPDDTKIAKIHDWPPCKNLCDVCTFLSVTGYMHIWIKNYSTIARPLHDLTCKYQPFIWIREYASAIQALKEAIINSPMLIPINYTADHIVYLAIDLSIQGVGWILLQDFADGQCCLLCFGSISWNKCEAYYLQAKIKLYGLFCALHTL